MLASILASILASRPEGFVAIRFDAECLNARFDTRFDTRVNSFDATRLDRSNAALLLLPVSRLGTWLLGRSFDASIPRFDASMSRFDTGVDACFDACFHTSFDIRSEVGVGSRRRT
jgi:hypothetical protein